MPIYDYTCTACGHAVEVMHGIHDHGPRFCPECTAEGTMRKGFAPPAVHFKGSGWAKKDRRATSTSTSTRPAAPTPKVGAGSTATTAGDTGGAGTPGSTPSEGAGSSAPSAAPAAKPGGD
jgi:putative FmdB family regulatory protein